MLSRLRFRLKRCGERGVVLPIVALSMVGISGLVALSIDVGRMTQTRRALQNAADGAAHAGVQVLPNDVTDAQNAAYTWASRNGVSFAEVASVSFSRTNVNNDTITVTTRRTVPSTFGRVVGFDSGTITATAKAVVGSIASSPGLFPFGLVDLNGPSNPGFGYSYGQQVVLREAPSNFFGPGNYGFLRIDGNGGSNIRTTLDNGGSITRYHIGDSVDTQTGQATGPVTSGLQDWANSHGDNWDNSPCNDWNASHTYVDGKLAVTQACRYRLVLIPIINYWPNGNGTVQILGFAQMYMQHWQAGDGKRLDAIFIQDTYSHPGAQFGAIDDYGTRIIKLTN
jgi:hypothetical protein